MKRARHLPILLLILSVLLLILSVLLALLSLPIFLFYKQNDFYKTHILGGFSLNTPESVMKAAEDGIQVAFQYNPPPSQGDELGQKLDSLQMKVIDGYISSYLSGYECHRTKTVKPPPLSQEQYCQVDSYQYLTDEDVLLASIAAHLKQVKDNQLVIGYWVLDDWVSWDAGSARSLLIKIHHLIQQYTPGRPAICVFGGFVHSDPTYGWNDWLADNFSPQGCDEVGLYIYAPPISNTTPRPSPDGYDWSMSALLPTTFASLQHRGWNITKEPLIGIGQAFGGPKAHSDNYWVTPNAKDIETQSKSFCEHGATGLVFYAWHDTEFGPATQTPMNNAGIEMGIRNGIAACKLYWAKVELEDA